MPEVFKGPVDPRRTRPVMSYGNDAPEPKRTYDVRELILLFGKRVCVTVGLVQAAPAEKIEGDWCADKSVLPRRFQPSGGACALLGLAAEQPGWTLLKLSIDDQVDTLAVRRKVSLTSATSLNGAG